MAGNEHDPYPSNESNGALIGSEPHTRGLYPEAPKNADDKASAKVRAPKNLPEAMFKAIRPKQWVKNVLVLAAPLAAGSITDAHVLGRAGIAFVAFCLASSCIYLINDAIDVESDRNHPTKRYRPIAAGVVPVKLAYVLAVVLGVASLAISWFVTPNLALVMAIDARLLVLDEPTLGLDILYRKQFYQRLLEDYFDEQKTIVITTHQVEEIEHILTDVMFIRDGKVVLNAAMDDVGSRYTEVLVSADALPEARALGARWNPGRKRWYVPTGVALEPFESVIDSVRYTRALYGEPPDDAHIESVLRSLALLCYRLGLLVGWTSCALPGTILNMPVILLAKIISKRKAKEALAASQVKLYGRDVLATWKVLVSLVVTPVLYVSYAAVATALAYRSSLSLAHKRLMPLYVMVGLPVVTYGTIKMSEVGIDVYKSLPPLVASLLPGRRRVIEQIQRERVNLTAQLHQTIEELKPEGWNYTDIGRGSYTAKPPPLPEEMEHMLYNGRPLDSSGGRSLSHPMNVMDEWLFGWSTSRRDGDWAAHRAEVVDNDLGADYEDALHVYEHQADDAHRAAPRQRTKRPRSHDFRATHPSVAP